MHAYASSIDSFMFPQWKQAKELNPLLLNEIYSNFSLCTRLFRSFSHDVVGADVCFWSAIYAVKGSRFIPIFSSIFDFVSFFLPQKKSVAVDVYTHTKQRL